MQSLIKNTSTNVQKTYVTHSVFEKCNILSFYGARDIIGKTYLSKKTLKPTEREISTQIKTS